MRIDITRGGSVLARLDDPDFVDDWERLRSACDWSTSFQSFAFVDCWYRLHDVLYEAIIVEGRDAHGNLVGILTLARARSGDLLVGAGDIHAEYQTWLSTETDTEAFMWGALDSLERAFPHGRLHFNHLSPKAPISWAARDAATPRRIHLRPRVRGVMDLGDPQRMASSLRKGHNRNRLNSLRRYGEVTLETIDTVGALEREIDEIGVMCDIRQGAVNDSLPFANNLLKRPLHLGLMERGLLHVTILRVGRSIASAHLDMRNGDEVLIYLIAHAPAFGRYSPGSLHIRMLGLALAEQGYTGFDLSPGGGYKDRYATRHDTVHRMTVRFALRDRIVAAVSSGALSAATTVLNRSGRTPRSAQQELGVLLGSMKRLGQREGAGPDAGTLVLRLHDAPPGGVAAPRLAIDQLRDLIPVISSALGPATDTGLLPVALPRLEAGHRALTLMNGGALAECWWLTRLDPAPTGKDAPVPADLTTAQRVLLYDPYLAAGGDDAIVRGQGLPGLVDAVKTLAPTAAIFAAVNSGDSDLIRDLLDQGATVVGTLLGSPPAPDGPATSDASNAPPADPLMHEVAGRLQTTSAAEGKRGS